MLIGTLKQEEFMSQNSKYNNRLDINDDQIDQLLSQPISNGRDMVFLCRKILRIYSALGLSIDDLEIENIVGIESETDTIDINSHDCVEELDKYYVTYRSLFEESRELLKEHLAKLRKAS
jgi:hypothetical protein